MGGSAVKWAYFEDKGYKLEYVSETDKLVKELWNSHVDHVGMIHCLF